ncbi:MAG: UvrD-helicase domain-containing protein [Bacteriovoracaceae bacterium]
MAQANSEQLKAIEHQGGILLKAGAGSGKTFVLVQHINYLTDLWFEEYKTQREQNWESFIKSKFSKIVMMTFTKKAAGEMNIRLHEKFRQKLLNAPEETKEIWQQCSESLPLLTVTTIDGFCRKLLTSGLITGANPNAPVIFKTERKDQIKKIYRDWLSTKSDLDDDSRELLFKEQKAIVKSLVEVFSDPGLRIKWRNFKLSQINLVESERCLAESFEISPYEELLLGIENLELPSEVKEQKAFDKNMMALKSTGLPKVNSVENLNSYLQILQEMRMTAPSKNTATPASLAVHEMLKEFKKWINKWDEVFSAFTEDLESKIIPWAKLFHDVFIYIDEHLDLNQGVTFGDMEYLVSNGLEDEKVRSKIKENYSYFIVDEFQDTSEVQFNIIRNLINNDFNKLFCVGDEKQAIYGFRGGSIKIFRDCQKLVPHTLDLFNNYRSLPTVINFNNSLFDKIMTLGEEFVGHDIYSYKADPQRVPEEVNHPSVGSLEIWKTKLPEIEVETESDYDEEIKKTKKWSAELINKAEAMVLAEAIVSHRKEYPLKDQAILYRKLKPSLDLIQELMRKKIGFTAQFKFALNEDPIIALFILMLKRDLIEGELKDTFVIRMGETLFDIIELSMPADFMSYLNQYDLDKKFWGLTWAFRKFLFRLGLAIENYDLNLDQIDLLAHLFEQDEEVILGEMKSDDDKLSLDFRWGTDSSKVILMTAHTSKGLEFDHVYLGGIYTNGTERANTDLIGKLPGSFSWYRDLSTKDKALTPQLRLERDIESLKNFSESKRLFYVTCTRAKEKLVWVDFEYEEDQFTLNKNSWIQGLNIWREGTVDNSIKIESHEIVLNEDELKKLPVKLPLFHFDNMGLSSKTSHERFDLIITPELSVTRLSSITQCPRKYYYQNVLKMAEESISSYAPIDDSVDEVVVSSMQRGTDLHLYLSLAIKGNGILPRRAYESKERDKLQWVLDQINSLKTSHRFISEEPIKFSFFGHMISGIPDFYALPIADGASPEIWDFKTGRITEEKLYPYWFQLKCYAYALYQIGQIEKTKSFDLKLCFIDEQKFLTQQVSYENVVKELLDYWTLAQRPETVNLDHCSQCPYGEICPSAKLT